MNKFRDALYRFMYGRNGVDALNWALVILELVVSILSSIIRVQGVSQALYFVSMVLMFTVLIRIFSRNLARRQAENAKFLTWWTPKANAIRGATHRRRSRSGRHDQTIPNSSALSTARVRSRTPSLDRMFDTWFLTVPSATPSELAISLLL